MTIHLTNEDVPSRWRALALLSPLGQVLVEMDKLQIGQLARAQTRATRSGLRLADVLYTRFGIARRTLAQAESQLYQTQLIDPVNRPADPRLLAMYGPHLGLQHGLLPWRRMGGCVVVLTSRPDLFGRHQRGLERVLGPVRMAITTEDQLETAIHSRCGATLVRRAEHRVAVADSSRNWNARRALFGTVFTLICLGILAYFAPVAVLLTFTTIAVVLMLLTSILKLCAALIGRPVPHPDRKDLAKGRLPVITLLIPLHHERAIAEHLLTRLEAMDYPRELLDVCLVLEASDTTTREAIGRAKLLTWMRTVMVPAGTIKTKPRALNYALDTARGSIIGVYDAEDAPAVDQLRIVASHFARAGPEVACLQGVLDYYNSATNWLTRCFTIEYASWFRVVLPGFARMGLVVPLGGTTLFFRRNVLEELGGWDAHNVTEDADLGVRLARRGYRTEFIPSVTEEEANGRAWPWVKQRSRWLKGYAITWGVHMRRPRALLRDLGLWRFFGVQLLFLGTLSQFLLAPLIWSLMIVPFGWSHPLDSALPYWAMISLAGLFVATEIIHLGIAALAVSRANKRWLIKWAITMQAYFPLAVIATYRGLLELTWKPFFWDKTAHGVLLPMQTPTQPLQPLQRRGVSGLYRPD